MNKLTIGRFGILAGWVLAGFGFATDAEAQRHGRSVDADRSGPRGGSVSVDGEGYGRFRSGSVDVDVENLNAEYVRNEIISGNNIAALPE